MQMAPHRYRGRKIYRYSRPPSWPFSPSACVQHSSELLLATCPRAVRGRTTLRTNAREAVGCIGLGSRGLAPSLLASSGTSSHHQIPPPARQNNNLPMRTHSEPRQYPNFGRQMARRNTENEIILVCGFPTRAFVRLLLKSA
jgi:hypothetical protein